MRNSSFTGSSNSSSEGKGPAEIVNRGRHHPNVGKGAWHIADPGKEHKGDADAVEDESDDHDSMSEDYDSDWSVKSHDSQKKEEVGEKRNAQMPQVQISEAKLREFVKLKAKLAFCREHHDLKLLGELYPIPKDAEKKPSISLFTGSTHFSKRMVSKPSKEHVGKKKPSENHVEDGKPSMERVDDKLPGMASRLRSKKPNTTGVQQRNLLRRIRSQS